MEYETLCYEKEDRVGIVTLNRPQRLNALSRQLLTELGELIDDMEKDDSLRVVILTGAPRSDGRPCFCAGADLKEAAEKGNLLWARLGSQVDA